MKDTLSRVIGCIATATRYPTELLSAQADLENDLGIDSVKNLEIVLALGEEFKLDLAAHRGDRSIRTIQNVVDWIDGLMATAPTAPAAPQASEMEKGARPQTMSEMPAMSRATAPRAAGAWQAFNRPASEASPTSMDRQLSTRNEVLRKASSRSEMASPVGTQQPRSKPSTIRHFHTAGQDARVQGQSAAAINKSLDGRIALVTGSGRAVGRTIARTLAARGAHVIVNSFHSRELGEQTADEIVRQGGKATHLWGSIANPVHVDRIFDQVEQQFGQLDMLVCNASDGRIGSFLELTAEDWDRAFRTNVSGHYQCAVRASELMRTTGGSIATLSAVGSQRYIDGLGSQGVVKAAVETLTRYLACELGPLGIRVNCVVGGPVYGDLLAKFPAAAKTQAHWESITPDGELCSPVDLANAIAFLMSDDARGITGSIMVVDHGFSATADNRPIRRTNRDSVLDPSR